MRNLIFAAALIGSVQLFASNPKDEANKYLSQFEPTTIFAMGSGTLAGVLASIKFATSYPKAAGLIVLLTAAYNAIDAAALAEMHRPEHAL